MLAYDVKCRYEQIMFNHFANQAQKAEGDAGRWVLGFGDFIFSALAYGGK